MTDKYDIDKLITAFLDKTATEEELAYLEEWVKADPGNNRYFQKTRNIRQGMHPVFNPADINEKEAKEKVFRQINKKNPAQTFIIYWQRIAAIMVIPFIIASIYLFIENKSAGEDTVYQEITSPYGMYSQANLPDGSKVWLNGGSTLKFPVRFKGNKRDVFLSGEGYFEVEANPQKPFMVKTELMTLHATGTAFNIEAFKEDSITAITLVEGKVDVSLKNSTPVALNPGERILFNNTTSKGSIAKTDPYKWYAWKDGITIFRDDPLEYVFKRLSLIFNVDIILKDPELADAPYRATFEEESLDEILRLLELTAPIKFTYSQRGKTPENRFDKQKIEVHRRTSKK